MAKMIYCDLVDARELPAASVQTGTELELLAAMEISVGEITDGRDG